MRLENWVCDAWSVFVPVVMVVLLGLMAVATAVEPQTPHVQTHEYMDTYQYQQMLQRIEEMEENMLTLNKQHVKLLQRVRALEKQDKIESRRSSEVNDE
jgi:hypothetical protein